MHFSSARNESEGLLPDCSIGVKKAGKLTGGSCKLPELHDDKQDWLLTDSRNYVCKVASGMLLILRRGPAHDFSENGYIVNMCSKKMIC